MSGRHEVIDLGSSSDEDSFPADHHPRPIHGSPDSMNSFDFSNNSLNGHPPKRDRLAEHEHSRRPRVISYEVCLKGITEIFPEICHDHVKQLYDQRRMALEYDEDITQALIEQIMDSGKYPQERDRLKKLKELKRKREDQRSDDEEAARWKYDGLKHSPLEYAKVSKMVLQEAFPMIPARFLEERFKEYGHFYAAYLDIAKLERSYDSTRRTPYVMLKSQRHNTGLTSEDLMHRLRLEGHDFDGLKEEIEAARQRRKKEDHKRDRQAKEAAEAEAKDQDQRNRGEVIECACCFDEAPISKITHCNGEMPHFFCYDCARMNANNDIGINKYDLQCMDGSVCKATFSKAERARFLNEKAIEKLESLEQQDAIRLAMDDLQDFVTCPFCHYGHICPPVEIDKEFRCAYSECKEVSCRLCKEKSHIPLSCEEYKKENGISERRAIEEARTEALIRTCPKCKVRILKEDGCNKVVCTTCYSVICDYCGKDISKLKYNHFDGQGHGPPGTESGGNKCPLYDQSNNRKDNQIEEAGKAAMDKIRMENPSLSEDDLKIKFSKEVEAMKHNDGRHHIPHHHRHYHHVHNFVPRRHFPDIVFPRQNVPNVPNVPLPPFRPNEPPAAGIFRGQRWDDENARIFDEQRERRERINADHELIQQQHDHLRARRQEMQAEYEAFGKRTRLEALRKQNQAHIDFLTAQNQARRASREQWHGGERAPGDNTPGPIYPLEEDISRRNPDPRTYNEPFAPYVRFREQGQHRGFEHPQDPLRRQPFTDPPNDLPPHPRRDSPNPFARQKRQVEDLPPEDPWEDLGKGVKEFLDDLRPGNFFRAFVGDEPPDDPNSRMRREA